MTCSVCGERPRVFWTFRTEWWRIVCGERLCPGCYLWTVRLVWNFAAMGVNVDQIVSEIREGLEAGT